jgi:hypothetical protein
LDAVLYGELVAAVEPLVVFDLVLVVEAVELWIVGFFTALAAVDCVVRVRTGAAFAVDDVAAGLLALAYPRRPNCHCRARHRSSSAFSIRGNDMLGLRGLAGWFRGRMRAKCLVAFSMDFLERVDLGSALVAGNYVNALYTSSTWIQRTGTLHLTYKTHCIYSKLGMS